MNWVKHLAFVAIALAVQLVPVTPVSAQVPADITREWIRNTFLHRYDILPDSTEERKAAEWRTVRHRPEVFDILIYFAEADGETFVVRANAIVYLGNTGHRRAFAYLFDLLSRLPEGDPYRVNAALGIGSGREHTPEEGYVHLERLLNGSDLRERRAAADALGVSGTARAQAMLRRAAGRERDSFIRASIQENLLRAERQAAHAPPSP